jgi:hypothetical protein
MRSRADGGIAHNLGFARVVAQIEENQVAEIPADVHPPRQKDSLPRVGCAKLTAVMRSLSITEKV